MYITNQLRFILFMFKSIKLVPKYFKENKLTYPNVRRFIQGNYRLFTFEQQPRFLKEQIWFRLSKANPECLKNTFCPCQCETLKLIHVEESCPNNCYPYMVDEDTWGIYKEINNITQDRLNQLTKDYYLYGIKSL